MPWVKHPASPVLDFGTLFDCCVVPDGDRLRMWFSWRDRHALGHAESADGVGWSNPQVVLAPDAALAWQKDDVNRPHVLMVGGRWYMWYTGQNHERHTSALGFATSEDGLHWERVGDEPVLEAAGGWEKSSVMCPHVQHEDGRFRMWYSGGEIYEPDAIGYAESADGINWQREAGNPVLTPAAGWESARVTGACIVPRKNDYLACYIGFAEGFEKSCLGLARSRDGIHDWERYPGNPMIQPGAVGEWDDCNVYKPYLLNWRERWWLWYNASRASDRREQIGLATAEELEF
jgi:predicted GH43/DUF377 family glycosyl hydrolase